MSLFRKEVLARPSTDAGSMLMVNHPAMHLVQLFVALLLAGLVALALFAQYTRRANAQGLLVPPQGAARVYTHQDGVVYDLRIHEGMHVEAGQELAVIRSSRSLEQNLLYELSRQQKSLEGSLSRVDNRAQSDLARLREQDAALSQEIEQLKSQRSIQAQRLTLAEQKREAMRALLGSGYVSANGFREYEDAALNQAQQLKDLERQQTTREAERLQLAQDIQHARMAALDERAQLSNNESELKQRSLEIAERQESLLLAPVSGRVTAIQAVVGQTANPTQPLLTIIPDGTVLEADLLVPSRAIGFVKPGQPVRLQIAAFPYQRYGLQAGVVRSISQSVLGPTEINLPLELHEPVYRVKVALRRQSVEAFGQPLALMPGMAVSADIVVDKRPLWQWLFEPLIAVRGKMFG